MRVAGVVLGLAVELGALGAAESDEPPAGLSGGDWAQIQRSIEASEFHAVPVSMAGATTAFEAPNRRQAYRTIFRREGIEIVPQTRKDSWRLGLAMTGYGYEGDVRPVMPVEPLAIKDRVEYRRGPVTEWYVNRGSGLEQGFDLHEPQPRRDGALVVTMAVRGGLDVSARVDGISFAARSGETVVRYTGLKAWDADRRPLEARIEAEDREVRVIVDAQGAAFPITVDPTFVHEAQLLGHGDPVSEAGAQFGYSVSVAGDTLLVGEPNRNTPGATDSGSAWVFVRAGSAWTLQQTLSASDRGAGDRFGASVVVSGDTAVIGADLDDTPGGADAGSAYVFVRTGAVWTEQQKLLASDGTAGDGFGRAISLSGDTVLVGAWNDDPVGTDSGSAYVFVRAGTTWSQQQKLVAADGGTGHRFGFSVSVFGDTAVAGAPALSSAGSGAAYVFVRSGTTWTQQQRLVASDATTGDWYGYSVAVFGDTAMIGSRYDQPPGGWPGAGSVYVFVRSGASWSEQQHLVAPDGLADDAFGFSVSLSADTAVIGAPFDDVLAFGDDFGSTYVFVRSGGTWAAEQKITGEAPNGSMFAGESFGFSVSLSGDTLAAGSNIFDGLLGLNGMAHVFVRSGNTWTRQESLLPLETTLAGDVFGSSVSISGDVAVVGAPSDTFLVPSRGSASVFERSGSTWSGPAKLWSINGATGDGFGTSVSVSGDWIVVGAPTDDDTQGGTDSGSAFPFTRGGPGWFQTTTLLASDRAANDLFGSSVSISGDTAVVGAPGDDAGSNADVGSAYVFVRTGGVWNQQQRLSAPGGAPADRFGSAVSIDGNTVVVGAPWAEAGGGSIPNAGAAFVFVRAGTAWTLQQALFASDAAASDNFGHAVFISGDTVVVGSVRDDTPISDAGSAYVFVRSGTVWTQQQKLLASDGEANDGFGFSVSVSGDAVVVGAVRDTTPAGTSAGSAYAFTRSGATWSQFQKLVAPDAGANDEFGVAVAIAGDTAVVGAHGDDRPGGADAGSAHVFRFASIADVGLTISDSPDPVPAGSDVVYTIGVSNTGPDAAAGVQVALPTPPGLAFVSNAGACTTPFPCALGTLAAGQTVMIVATFHVPLGYTGPNPIAANTAATTNSSDPVSTNNQATSMTTVAAASGDLHITKTGPPTVQAGSNVVYTITVQNAGPSDAADVEVADPTPAGLTFVSNTGACATPFPCGLGMIPPAQSRVITATFNVPVGYGGPNPIANQATVSSTTADPNPANNTATATTPVLVATLQPTALDVDASGNQVFQPNEIVLVAPSWRNDGSASANNVLGAASNFTGPAGPTYAIHDDAAAYGTIAVGATASCGADCYVVGNVASTRPALHWDTAFLENLTPGGTTRTWQLHIGDSFIDVPPSSGFYRFVETLLHHGVTGGCSPTQYCPATATTRDQMAVFVLAAKEGPAYVPAACTTPVFNDVPAGSPFCRWIEELARRGVVGGCGGGNYCPASPVTREQMAIFVLKTLDPTLSPPACGTPMFADVPASSAFCPWIEELARRGVVSGCGGGNYCPAASVTRDQMGVFLGVTFGLTLYGL